MLTIGSEVFLEKSSLDVFRPWHKNDIRNMFLKPAMRIAMSHCLNVLTGLKEENNGSL
jgi:hypothetical protein